MAKICSWFFCILLASLELSLVTQRKKRKRKRNKKQVSKVKAPPVECEMNADGYWSGDG